MSGVGAGIVTESQLVPDWSSLELPLELPMPPKILKKKQSQNLTIVRKILFYIFTK